MPLSANRLSVTLTHWRVAPHHAGEVVVRKGHRDLDALIGSAAVDVAELMEKAAKSVSDRTRS